MGFFRKKGYVLGFVAGSNYVAGNNMVLASAILEKGVLWSLNKYQIYEITVGQIFDGLDKLYEDFKNRNINISAAIHVVKRQIQGAPNEDIERILLYLRGGEKDITHLIVKDEKGRILKTILFP